MNNLEKSEVVISLILTILLDRGLQKNDMSFETLKLDDSYYPFFIPCIDWLENEGMVNTLNVVRTLDGGGHVVQPTITSKGLNVLGSEITIGDCSENFEIAIRKVAKTQQSYAGFGDFLGGLLGGFTKSLGA